MLEFHAPVAFRISTNTAGLAASLQADVVSASRADTVTGQTPTKLDRLLAVGQTPLVAWVLLLMGVIYFGYLYLEKVEKENERLSTNYNNIILKVLEQNTSLTNVLVSKVAPTTPSPEVSAQTSSPPGSTKSPQEGRQ